MTNRRRVTLAAAWLLLLVAPIHAQLITNPQTVSVIDSGTQCSVANTCAIFAPITGATTVTVSIAGTFSGTLTFEASADGSNFFSVLAANSATAAQATTTTTTGLYSLPNAGYQTVRARATSWSSGTATIAATRGQGNARLVSPVMPNGFQTFNGTGLEFGGCAWASNFFNCGVTTNGGTDRSVRLMGGGTAGNVVLQAGGSDRFILGATTGSLTNNSTGVIAASAAPSTPQANSFYTVGVAFASLGGSASNGTWIYCTDCTIANPCASGGSGAFAKRINGTWVCN